MTPYYVPSSEPRPADTFIDSVDIKGRRWVVYQTYHIVNDPYGGTIRQLVSENARISKAGEIVNWRKLSESAYSEISAYLRSHQ